MDKYLWLDTEKSIDHIKQTVVKVAANNPLKHSTFMYVVCGQSGMGTDKYSKEGNQGTPGMYLGRKE